MLRCLTFAAVGVALVSGCGNLLGLKQPTGATDGGGGDGAAAGDFTISTVHATARVPAGSFDFIDVSVARGTGEAAPISVTLAQPPAGITTSAIQIDAADTTGQLKVTGDTSLAIGSAYMLDITATDGTHTHDVMVPTTVTGVPGTLDVSFGSNATGVVDIALGTVVGILSAVGVDGSDDIVADGVNRSELGETPAVVQLDPNGNVVFSVTENPGGTTNAGNFNALAIAGNGRIIGVGISHNKNDAAAPDEPFICAFTGSGALDTTFDNGNSFEFADLGQDIQLTSTTIDGTNLMLETDDSRLFRIPVSGGNIDLNWNTSNGPLPVGITSTGPQAIAVDIAQHIYVVGQSGSGSGDAVIERITELGEIDTTFGSNGIIDPGIAGNATASLVQPDHSIVVAAATAAGNFMLFRVLSTGVLDPAFGSGGVTQPALPFTGLTVTSMTLQSDGKIIVAGNGNNAAVLARYLSDGTLDQTFGTNGAANIPAGLMPTITGVRLQSTGMLVISGGNADQPHSNGLDGNGYIARVWF